MPCAQRSDDHTLQVVSTWTRVVRTERECVISKPQLPPKLLGATEQRVKLPGCVYKEIADCYPDNQEGARMVCRPPLIVNVGMQAADIGSECFHFNQALCYLKGHNP